MCDLLGTSSHRSTIPNDLSVMAIHRNQRWGLSPASTECSFRGKGKRDGAHACRGGVHPSKYGFYQVREEKPQLSIGKIHLQLKEIRRVSKIEGGRSGTSQRSSEASACCFNSRTKHRHRGAPYVVRCSQPGSFHSAVAPFLKKTTRWPPTLAGALWSRMGGRPAPINIRPWSSAGRGWVAHWVREQWRQRRAEF